MKVVHIMEDYRPTVSGAMVRNSSMLEAYKKRFKQDDVYVVNLEGKKYVGKEVINEITVYREKNIFRQLLRAIRLVNRENADVIQGHNYRFLLIAYLASKLSRRHPKVYVEMHALYHTSSWKAWMGRRLLRKVSGVFVLAECAKKYLLDVYEMDGDKISVIRNGMSSELQEDLKSICPNDEINRWIQDQKQMGRKIIFYSGAFIEWQGVNFLAKNIERINNEVQNISILMIGDGPEFENVSKLAEKQKNVLIHKGIDRGEINIFMDLVDVVIVPREKNLSTDTAVPLKLIEAMQKGKCIVASGDNGIRELLNDSNGLLYSPNIIEELISKIQQAMSRDDLRITLGKKAQDDVDEILTSWDTNSVVVHDAYLKGMRRDG
ncbi:MAG: glycosyltransferase [Lachnospiraceae bacterium]|nr:glycosyltransferase [Lachnospiraceae bacterium]